MKTNKDKLENIVKEIEERLINTDVETIMEYIEIIYDETGLMEEEIIYYNDEDFIIPFCGDDITEYIRAMKYGYYDINDDYVVIDVYRNLESYNNKTIKDYINMIANYMAEIFAEDYINDEGKFKGLPIYENL